MADRKKLSSRNDRGRGHTVYTLKSVFVLGHAELITFLLFSLILLFYTAECLKGCNGCDQGRCINDTCVCLPGWRGLLCDECYGRISLQKGREGVIHDGAANYSKDLSCSWLLEADAPNMRVHLQINDFATECVWDHLYIHNGDSAFSPLIAAYSGILWGLRSKPHLKFQLKGKYAFIHFYSDAAFTLPGFNISYVIDDCALECSENGVCNNSVCQCQPGFTGQNCDSVIDHCAFNCSDYGVCDNGACDCFDEYQGPYCSISKRDLYVNTMPLPPRALSRRASLSLLADGDGDLWILGGYKMGDMRPDNNMFKYIPRNKTWEQPTEIGMSPLSRYGHSAVYYKNAFFIYGGVSNTRVLKDFWKYDIVGKSWSEFSPGPRNISGHTAHVYEDTMIVFFGYSSDFGYSSKVMEYNFTSGNWTVDETTGSRVQGGYGHTSVFDHRRIKIYVYGGYHSQGTSNYKLTDKLYQYDPVLKEWFVLRSSGSARYLHSAAMMNGLMITFGGNINNDTRLGPQAKCFASDFMVYDRDCNSWFTLPTPEIVGDSEGIDRFGQAMVSVNNVIYMFGGFNSIAKYDLLEIRAGNCSFYENENSCSQARPGVKCLWEGSQCRMDDVIGDETHDNCPNSQDPYPKCSGYNTCDSCLNTAACQWCGNLCTSVAMAPSLNCSLEALNCTEDVGQFCGMFLKCKACEDHPQCVWDTSDKCIERTGSALTAGKSTCDKPCSGFSGCENCTQAKCMWCSSLNQCIDTNSYVVSFHYGQCMDWTTSRSACQANKCSALKNCEDCQARPKCGWCNDESETGTGVCFEGGMSGPIKLVDSMPQLDQGKCPDLSNRWFFNSCPKCQCNGHSICKNDSDICENCTFPMYGPHCEYCEDGFYGNPESNGTCKPCFCNGQADSCDPVTGNCYCRTRGVTGKTCEKCDTTNRYSGDPKNGGLCYYELNTDFQYTFNLSKKEDGNYTQINFLNAPTSSDKDVDFTLNCSTPALINITYRSKSFPEEKEYVSGRICDYFRTKFEHKNHAFGGKENTTFLVYVYNFRTPFILQISFSQFPKIDLVHFFVTFFSCFLSLVLIAAALWKVKHKYNSYRRRQQLMVEMEQMASRPFSTIGIEIDRKSNPITVDKKDHLDSVLRRRRKAGNKPSAVAIEPLKDNKAAILSLIIQLPTGGSDYAPSGQSGLAVGSALVSIGSHRKQSLEHIKGEKPKVRKNLTYNHPDTCA
ncbi:attractin [Aplysia californica]|uniref:Attractin n=1 Tax=Aplysia californica TaxID=6500 RepID=A0ABM0ZYA7_APLCA|nr:attractin [Aplysia californica]